MPALSIKLDGDGAWPDLVEKEVIHLANDATFEMSGLAGGMVGGKPSVAFRLDLPDGRVVIAETSWRLFAMAFHAFAAKFGERPDAVGMEILTDLGGGGPSKLTVQPDDAQPFWECEICGERHDVATSEAVLQGLYRHFREKHQDWPTPETGGQSRGI